MNLNNFEKNIDYTILQRGQSIFQDSNLIDDIEIKGNNTYKSVVYWTDDYEVSVLLDSDFNIKKYSCNCPFDGWPICKHQVATFYKLRKLLGIEIQTKSKIQKDKWEIVYKRTNTKAYFKRIIMESIKYASKWYWYVPWNRTDESLEWAREVIYKIDDFLEKEEYQWVIIALSSLIETLVVSLQEVDDSDGSYWDIISWMCIWEYLPRIIEEISEKELKKDKKFFLDEFTELVLNYKIHGFDFEKEIIAQLISLLDNGEDAKKIYDIIETLETKSEFSNYKIEKYRIVKDFFPEKMVDFLSKNGYDYSLQMYRVDEFIEDEKYIKAQEILLWLQEYDKKNNHTHISILEKLYFIAIKINDKSLIQKYSFEIFTQEPTKTHYLDYKHSQDKKIDILQEFDNYIKVINCYEYPDICLEENDEKRFISYFLRNHDVSRIDKYFTKLFKLIPDEIYAIYKDDVSDNLLVTRDRNVYKEQCRKIRKMYKIKQEETDIFIQDLMNKYKQRKALVEELGLLIRQ